MKISNTCNTNHKSHSGVSNFGRYANLLSSGLKLLLLCGFMIPGITFAQYDTSYAVQNTAVTFPGMTNVNLLNLKVVTTGSASTLSSMTLNTGGSTSASNIASAKLFYANAGSFTTQLLSSQQAGSAVSSPTGTFSFNGLSIPLSNGVNNFWLAYDLTSTATIGNVVDGQFTSVTVDGITETPGASNPTGNRLIDSNINFNYCTFPCINCANYQIGISRFELAGTTIVNPIAPAGNVQKIRSSVIKLYKDVTYPFLYKGGSGNPQNEKLFIDLDNDGFFSSAELLFSGATAASATTTGSLTINCSWPTGVHRLRIATDFGVPVDACTGNYGSTFDITVDFQNALPPVAAFTKPDTAYTMQIVKFTNTSQGLGYSYSWDFKNAGAGQVDATTTDGSYQFTSPGLYTTKLRMSRIICGSPVADSTTRQIRIINPTAVPRSEFIADRNITNQTLVVSFTDLSSWGANKWHWKITPATVNGNIAYVYANGTDSTSQNPQVIFLELGQYTVNLFTENILGAGSVINKPNYINNINILLSCGSTGTKEAAGFLADEGGAYSNYPNFGFTGKLCTFLIKPCASNVTFTFLDFDVSAFQVTGCFIQPGNTVLQPPDNVKIYDGTDNTGTPLHVAAGFPNGFTNGPNNIPVYPPSVTASSGSMFIEIWVNCAFNGRGFLAEWKSTPASFIPPVPEFTSTDTAYAGTPYTFTNTTFGQLDTLYWDFENDGVIDAGTNDVDIVFPSTGTQTVKLTVERCGSQVSLTKTIVVIPQTKAPKVGFRASRTSVIVGDTVRLIDETLNGGDAWTWTITPVTKFVYAAGSNSSRKNPYIIFTQTGTITVKLKVTSTFGPDSVTKSSYITVFSYCNPTVTTLGSDVGISRVIFGSINNSSGIGVTAYTKYNLSTSVERGATYSVTINRNTGIKNANRKVWIDFNRNGSFSDAGELVFFGPSSGNLSVTGQITIPKTADLGGVRMRVGVSADSSSNIPCGPNALGEFEDYTLYIIDDVTKPVITLISSNPLHIQQSAPFTDPGAIAIDNTDGNISNLLLMTSNVDINTPGKYRVVYNVSDLSGHKADSVVRIVIVDPDAIGPVITLLGGDTIYHPVKTPFTDPWATALDYVNGNMTSTITDSGTVNANIPGTYYITYNATDLGGNTGTKVRVVIVEDKIAPLITLKGNNPDTVNFGSSYSDPGTNVSDNYYTGLVASALSNVNTMALGTYNILYNVTDPSGNAALQVTRTVVVQDISAPVIILLGADTMIIDVYSLFNDPGVQVTDNHTQNLTEVITGNVDTAVVSDYTLTYTATDLSGNISSVKRVVRVVDRIKPVITLIGSAVTTIPRWSLYNDSGVNITDNYYSETLLKGIMVTTSTVDPNWEDTYQICYNVTDPSGNAAIQVCRLVKVEPLASSLSEFSLNNAISIYPNPNAGQFTIAWDTDKEISIEIYNSLGAVVHKELSKAGAAISSEIDLSGEASGIYFVRINYMDQTVTHRISCQK